MGKPVAFGVGDNKFVVERVVGSGSESESDDAGIVGDEREADGAASGDAGAGDRTGATPVDPSTLGSDPTAPYGRHPSGRRRSAPGSRRTSGGGERTAKSSAQATLDIAEILAMLHWGVATALKMPGLELTKDECDRGAKSIARLTELYGDIPGMDEKTMAWVQFAGTWGTIYGGRIVAAKFRAKKPTVVHTGIHNVG
jgi:hypothetical protein